MNRGPAGQVGRIEEGERQGATGLAVQVDELAELARLEQVEGLGTLIGKQQLFTHGLGLALEAMGDGLNLLKGALGKSCPLAEGKTDGFLIRRGGFNHV